MAAKDPLAGLGSNPLPNSHFADVMKSVRAVSGLQIPQITVPTPAERASFESAKSLVKNLGTRITAWKSVLPKSCIPAVFAVLPNGMTIDVTSLRAEGHHGLIIEGTVDGKPVMITMHQNNFVTVCLAVEDDLKNPRPEIGFHAS